jgi:hypothetical protein
MYRWCIFALLLLAQAFAQSNSASITGIVTDASGGVIAGASVAITNRGTGVLFRTETNSSGIYAAPSLIPGEYQVDVEFTGFKKKQIQNIVLETGQNLRLDASLALGALTEVVEVKATATPLKQETAEISTTISSAAIRNLPVTGRAPMDLALLSPGVASNGDASAQDYGGGTSINGSRTQGAVLLLDGAPASSVDGYAERLGSIEAIHEVKLLTGTYSAEYGRTSGTTVISQVKSGTSTFHGSLFEYHQNNVFNANNWQNNAAGVKPAALKTNEFGGTMGGPVPGARQKLFFFASFEGYRNRSPINRTRTIPDPSIRSGNFSALPSVINDPLAGAPFPNNIIPTSRLDQAGVKFLQLFPSPNTQGTFNGQYGIWANNWIRATAMSYPKNWGLARLDYNPTTQDKLAFTYGHINEGPRDDGLDFDNVLNTSRNPTYRWMKRATLSYTRFFSASMTNEFQAYVQRDPKIGELWFPDFDVTKELGIQKKIGNTLPTFSLSGGYGNHGNSSMGWTVNQPAGLSDVVTWLKGRHTARLGAQFYQHQFSYGGSTNDSGSYAFTGEITGLGAAGRNVPGNVIADLLLGAVKTANIQVPQIPVTRVTNNFALFVNDDWKVTDRLTLNLGLRWEYEQPQFVKTNVYSSIDLASGELLVAGRNASRTLNVNTDYLNFSPRLGVAYSLNSKTVVRSGVGVFFASRVVDNGTSASYPGWTGSVVFPDLGVGRAQPFTLTQGFPVEQVPAVTDPMAIFQKATPQSPLSVGGYAYRNDEPLPDSMQWHFGIQRDIGFNTVLDVGYVGSRSVHLARMGVPANNATLDKASAVVVQRVPIQQVRPFPNLAAFGAVLYDANASYHSLQIKATRRFASGLSVDGNYTFSKNIDTATKFGDSFQIPWQFRNLERARSSLDRTNVATVGWVYELPVGKNKTFLSNNRWASMILGGFQTNGIVSAASGLPFTITQNVTNLVLGSQRPDVVNAENLSGRIDEPVFVGAAYRWLVPRNDASFPFRSSSNLGIGNLGRNTSRAPGYWNLNLGIFRVFRMTEKSTLELRFEAFNALNHVNFWGPSANIDSASYGLISGASNSRQMKIGARIAF